MECVEHGEQCPADGAFPCPVLPSDHGDPINAYRGIPDLAYVLDNDFHPIEVETRNRLLNAPNGGDSELVPSKPIKIGKNCFIGCNSIILKGTVLGDGCVVGAGAVVSGKFEDNCVIAGNPARVIKRLKEEGA